MKIAMLAPIAWRTPPRSYGPWEKVTSLLTEALVAKGIDVTLFATGDSVTSANLTSVCHKPYGENQEMDAKVWECLHISLLMEQAKNFDIIHNQFDFLPLTYSGLVATPMVTTIHGFSSEKIIPVYRKYNDSTFYVSISDSDRHADLDYVDTVYHGIDPEVFTFQGDKNDYLLFYGRMHPDKGAHAAIQIAKRSKVQLIMAGPVQDQQYFDHKIAPHIDDEAIVYLGNVDQYTGNELLGNAKALLHPIYFEEPFGLSVAESMMCGTPVIAFDRGSMPELVIDGKTGFLVKSIDEAVEMVEKVNDIDPAYCREYALQKFSVDTMANKYMNIYKNLHVTPSTHR